MWILAGSNVATEHKQYQTDILAPINSCRNDDSLPLGMDVVDNECPELVQEGIALIMEDKRETITNSTSTVNGNVQISFTLSRFLSDESPWSSFTMDQ
jgi:hypothetical protein